MSPKRAFRPENEIFADLAKLCVRPGYVHAVAHFCFRDNVILYSDEISEGDMQRMFDPARLIRTEISTLIGLMVKAEIDWALPFPNTTQEYLDASEALLAELHDAMSAAMATAMFAGLPTKVTDPVDESPGTVMREPIFYGGESAYSFQYLDLAARKYAEDREWLMANRGFTIVDARAIALAIERIHSDQFVAARDRIRRQDPKEWTSLPCFSVSARDVSDVAGRSIELTERVLCAFALPVSEHNEEFNSLHDFNVACATPLLRMPNGEFLSLHSYALAEAIYDTPFYWMAGDKAYLPTLTKHRGDFAERFVAERLGVVFGLEQVYANVDIQKSKAVRVGEIDVLVVWGDRAIVIQAKSKRLTLEARKGNDQVIHDDFKKSVQDAYDQAIKCAALMQDKRVTLVSGDGRNVVFKHSLKEIYIFCVVSDPYPALGFQARQFLKTRTVDFAQPPLVMDVFTLDAMTEMLQTPLHFLSYVNRRANFADRILASQELTVLSYHLKHNLWIKSNVDLLHLGDDFSAGLDIAMTARRTKIPGALIPEGILTRVAQTTLGQIVKQIESRPEPATIDLGFQLLMLGEDATKDASNAIDELRRRARMDGKHHDLTLEFESEKAGLTIHINDQPESNAAQILGSYCERRKYKQKARRWFGICIAPIGPAVRFGMSLDYPWTRDEAMDTATRDMQHPKPAGKLFKALGKGLGQRIRSTDPCPCGSGRKYKKCHLR